MVRLERERIEGQNRRTDSITQAIAASDSADQRQFEYHSMQTSPWDIRAAVTALLEFNSLLERNNMKSELMRELEQRISWIEMLRDVDGADQEQLDHVIEIHQELLKEVNAMHYPVAEELSRNSFLDGLGQRIHLPGCTSETDLPQFHKWLNEPRVNHAILLEQWFRPFATILKVARILLGFIRDSAPFHPVVATKGWFETQLDSSRTHQMIRVKMSTDSNLFPEISVTSQSCAIACRNGENMENRPFQTSEDVTFDLSCCLF